MDRSAVSILLSASKYGDTEVKNLVNTGLYKGSVFLPALRTSGGPDFNRDKFRDVLDGVYVNTKHRFMGHGKGSIMAGGMPRASGVWIGLLASNAGLLKGVKARMPKLRWNEEVIRGDGILSYFTDLVGKPGGGPILVAIECLSSGLVNTWVTPQNGAGIPPGRWGFNPVARKIEKK
jgi:hypothetical protein